VGGSLSSVRCTGGRSLRRPGRGRVGCARRLARLERTTPPKGGHLRRRRSHARGYELTFPALRAVSDFVTVTTPRSPTACERSCQSRHNLVEGAGATGFAGLIKLRDRLAGSAWP